MTFASVTKNSQIIRSGLKPTFLFILTILILNNLYAQEKITLYYNSNWEVTKKEKATYFREAVFDLNTFKLDGEVKDFTINGTPIMTGSYVSDKKNGDFTFYYETGKIKSKGKYDDNDRMGVWDYFYQNGNPKQKAIFWEKQDNKPFSIIEYYDRNGKQLIKNGTGSWVNDSIEGGSLDRSSLNRLTGQFKDSLRTGTWKLYRTSDNQFIHSEQFRKGRFLGATVYEPMFNSTGTTSFEMLNKFPDENYDRLKKTERFQVDTTVFSSSLILSDVTTIFKTVTGKTFTIKERRAGYPGGDYNLLEFIASNIRYPISAIKNKTSGKVYVKVVIDTLGKAKVVNIFKGINNDLDNEAIRVIKLIDIWLPTLKDGKPVESSISIPVTFEIKE